MPAESPAVPVADRPERLDTALFRRGLAESREFARRLVMAGVVRVAGHRADKPSRMVSPEATVTIDRRPPFVGRGGEKLAAALSGLELDVSGRTCLDIGASTGGFTDCLLHHGAAHVIALDVGRGQLHWRLRNDSRVTVIEGFNARYLAARDMPRRPSFVTIDVSFISLRLVMPPAAALLPADGLMVCLVKPQFEAGRREVGRGGVVRLPEVRLRVLEDIKSFGVEQLGMTWLGSIASPIRGAKGNLEYLAGWRKKEVGKCGG